ncbi:saccharopine dehydrogenase NADP-binding domain-containing protein [Streptomyces glaucescens]|uniref:Putative Trans-acting enoyl reductase n=1 Tax=Streptomyces glaucescens TaxID=1907 RepID=A0A089YTI7_STRGA|nr:saccharopine dehydrogenase NADP-binding domain-containing protein [Streptomyces glaucescens]AIR96955.1 putative Trans-acting enoyl reductase [Streptomyces glaucescens]
MSRAQPADTRSAPVIGVLGGYGAVGTSAVRALAAEGRFRLRIGGRDLGAARALAAALPVPAQAVRVDVEDGASLAGFARGCRTVLNCSGPAYLLLGRARTAALAAGADYVDVMDDGGTPAPVPGRTVVLSAGLAPGLSGLLPAILARGPVPGGRFSGCYAGLGVFTVTGAVDYLLSAERGYGTPGAVWRGRVVPGALRVEEEHRLPGVPRPLVAHPFLTGEVVSRARALGLAEARWYNAFDGTAVLDVLNRSRGGRLAGPELRARAGELVRASALDAAGRAPYHLLWGCLEGRGPDGTPVRRTVVIRGADGSELTGLVGAFAAAAVCDGRLPHGVHRAADVLPADEVLRRLRDGRAGVTVAETEEAVARGPAPAMEEGVL